MDRDELEHIREKVAEEYGITLYRRYGEKAAAHFLGVDVTTLKRWRRSRKITHVDMGPRKKLYLGRHIVNKMIGHDGE